MFRQLTLGLILSSLTLPALAQSTDNQAGATIVQEETAGAIGGLLFGAATGGPPGALIGVIVGTLIGNNEANKNAVSTLSSDLDRSAQQLTLLREESTRIQRQYEIARNELQRSREEHAELLQVRQATRIEAPVNAQFALHFRTGSAEIEPLYRQQLSAFANYAASFPDAEIEITGYADRNGNTAANLRLSRSRSNRVKDFFTDIGLANTTIRTVAYGETRPISEQQSLESDFFDRRVNISLNSSGQQLLSQIPD